MPVKQYQLKEFRDFGTFLETKYRPRLDEFITEDKARNIANYITAFEIVKGLAASTGAPKAAIKLMEK